MATLEDVARPDKLVENDLVANQDWSLAPVEEFDLFEHSEHIGGTLTCIVIAQQPILQFILSKIVTIAFMIFLNRERIIYILMLEYILCLQ